VILAVTSLSFVPVTDDPLVKASMFSALEAVALDRYCHPIRRCRFAGGPARISLFAAEAVNEYADKPRFVAALATKAL